MVWKEKAPSAALIFGDGRVIYGHGLGVSGIRIGEVCFNTSMSGYQEILTDPSYTDQIITFTFPHIGNTGTNKDDNETANRGLRSTALGMIIGEEISNPSNYRSQAHLEKWLCSHTMIGLSGVDIRAITAHIREHGMFDAALVHDKKGRFAVEETAQQIGEWGGLEGKDLATKISHSHIKKWHEGAWQFLPNGKGKYSRKGTEKTHIAVIDFGIKSNILRQLSRVNSQITIYPATTPAQTVLASNPDGIFLSNGPGDPAATASQIQPQMEAYLKSGKPIFGICLGHQILALTLGAKTVKMPQGHHGANHPVKELSTGKVEITSMNHGFCVDSQSLPKTIEETHISLFDKTNCGIKVKGKPIFSVQHHPEASPGPQDSFYLFDRFIEMIESA